MKKKHPNPLERIFAENNRKEYFDQIISDKILHGIKYQVKNEHGKFGDPKILRPGDKLPSVFTVENSGSILYRVLNRKERRDRSLK